MGTYIDFLDVAAAAAAATAVIVIDVSILLSTQISCALFSLMISAVFDKFANFKTFQTRTSRDLIKHHLIGKRTPVLDHH